MSEENQETIIPTFNPSAFMEADEVVLGTPTPEVETEQPDPFVPAQENETTEPEIEQGENEEVVTEPDVTFDDDFSAVPVKPVEEKEISNDELVTIGEKLGVKLETKEDLNALREKLKGEAPVVEPTQNYNHLRLSENDIKIVKNADNVLNKIEDYSDEDILGFQLKQMDPEKYADEDELEFQISNIKESGLLKMQASSIRKSIIDSAKTQRNTIVSNAEEKLNAQTSTQRKELETSIKAYKEGFHGITISPEEALGVFRKVEDNSLFDEIESSQANVAEMAILWEKRDLIYKTLENPSLQPGIKRFFNELSNVQVKPASGKQVLSDPTKFNPSAFMSSDDFKTK